MKAPFSDKAKRIFKDERASKDLRTIVTTTGSLDGARMKMSSGKSVRVYASSSAKASQRRYRK